MRHTLETKARFIQQVMNGKRHRQYSNGSSCPRGLVVFVDVCCRRKTDDLVAGKSYYIVEAEAVLPLVALLIYWALMQQEVPWLAVGT